MATTTKHLIFLKDAGNLIAMLEGDSDLSVFDTSKFVIKTVDLDVDAGEFWHGDHATGGISKKSEKPVVYESVLKYNTNAKILEEYPIHKQLNIVIDMLAQSELPNTEDFAQMIEFIAAARAVHNEKVQAYASQPDVYTFISSEDDQAHADTLKTFE